MLPPEIHTENSPDYSRFDLPVRPIGPIRFLGLVPMLFAVGFAWMPASQMLRMLREVLSEKGSGFEWIFIGFLSLFVFAALMPFGFGLLLLAGRTRITLKKDRMILTELAGPVRWSRKVKYEQIERLEIGGAQASDGRSPALLNAMCGIVAIVKSGKKTPVAVGYPRELLEPLVAEISNTLRFRGAAVPVQESAPLPDCNPAIPTERRTEKPADSTIELTDSGWGVELKVPSRGLWKESYGLLAIGLIWCLITGAVTIGSVLKNGFSGGTMGALGFLLIFWTLGIGMLVLGIHLGTRRWSLRADRSRLEVKLKSALRSREWRWAASEIAEVRVGDSGTKVNDQTLEQLQIMTHDSRKTGMMTGRSREELAWVATTLQGALGVQTAAVTDAPPRIDPSRKGR